MGDNDDANESFWNTFFGGGGGESDNDAANESFWNTFFGGGGGESDNEAVNEAYWNTFLGGGTSKTPFVFNPRADSDQATRDLGLTPADTSSYDASTWASILSKLGLTPAQAGSLAAGLAGGVGLSSLLGGGSGGSSGDTGYKGGIPFLAASRTMLPIPHTVTTAAGGEAYLRANPDVAAAYKADSQGLSPTEYAAAHYAKYGQGEGRTLATAPRRAGSGGVTYFSPMQYKSVASNPGLTTLPFTLPTSTPAGPTPAFTAAQNAGIVDFWNKNSNDPQAIIAGMKQYGVNAEQLAAAIGKPLTVVGDYLMAGGAPSGFGGYTPAGRTPPVNPTASSTNYGVSLGGGGGTGGSGLTTLPFTLPTSTPAGPTPAFTAAQNAGIVDFWNKNSSNPNAIIEGMKQYGVNVAQLAAAIGKPLTVVGDYLMAGGAPSGFGGYTPAGRTPPVNPTASSTNYGVSLGGGGGTGGSGLTTLPFTLPTSTPAGPTTLGGTGGGTTAAPAVTAAQNAGIADFWNKNSGDPQAIIAGMQQYGVNAEQLAAAIGKPTNAVGNYLMAGGADRGFGGYSPGIADTYIASASGGANMPSFARGGIASLAKGRLLNGPGDGVSDSIRASIDGHQPAALADGEYVIPARIVSELGNGSTKAGAQQLDAMMKRIQTTRRKATDIAANTRATKHLPA